MPKTETEMDAALLQFVSTHSGTAVKAALIAATTLFSVVVLTGSVWKALVISLFCLVMSAFSGWRRDLERIALFVFCAAAVYWCDQEIVSHVRVALAGG